MLSWQHSVHLFNSAKLHPISHEVTIELVSASLHCPDLSGHRKVKSGGRDQGIRCGRSNYEKIRAENVKIIIVFTMSWCSLGKWTANSYWSTETCAGSYWWDEHNREKCEERGIGLVFPANHSSVTGIWFKSQTDMADIKRDQSRTRLVNWHII